MVNYPRKIKYYFVTIYTSEPQHLKPAACVMSEDDKFISVV